MKENFVILYSDLVFRCHICCTMGISFALFTNLLQFSFILDGETTKLRCFTNNIELICLDQNIYTLLNALKKYTYVVQMGPKYIEYII